MSEETTALLRKLGPALTTKHIAELVSAGVSETTARKRIQRATGDYQKLAGIRFEKNTRFIYRPEDYGENIGAIIRH